MQVHFFLFFCQTLSFFQFSRSFFHFSLFTFQICRVRRSVLLPETLNVSIVIQTFTPQKQLKALIDTKSSIKLGGGSVIKSNLYTCFKDEAEIAYGMFLGKHMVSSYPQRS